MKESLKLVDSTLFYVSNLKDDTKVVKEIRLLSLLLNWKVWCWYAIIAAKYLLQFFCHSLVAMHFALYWIGTFRAKQVTTGNWNTKESNVSLCHWAKL